jgi:mono/diheme cytochrome c family protein
MASSSRLEPQEKGKISVKVDIKGKSGNIQKTVQVHANDPETPVTVLSLIMQLKDTVHSSKHAAQEIFRGQCRECHVDKGKNKKGFELFLADCIMCHDFSRSASPLPEMRKRSIQYLSNAVRNGVNGSSMPGWSTKKGGPLGDEEIDSLVDLIKKEVKTPGP